MGRRAAVDETGGQPDPHVRMIYLRFVVNRVDGDSNRREGLFQAIAALRNVGELSAQERERANELRAWFSEHLKKPRSFSKSNRPHAAPRAISWFKDTAREHIARMYELAAILEAHDVMVDVIQTAKPGYVVYEDEFQVTAEPFSETNT
jgi:hypothetical protein